MKLIQGSRVVIAGGGPAGSLFALLLLGHAAEAGLDIEVVIYEARDFQQPGPGGCNKCAGILSSQLLANLSSSGLQLPLDIVQSELDTYMLHLDGDPLPIRSPHPSRRIISVYRGSGPRWGKKPYPRSFDGWLLHQAQERGAVVRRGRVRTVKQGSPAVVVTGRETVEADLVVVATGINSDPPLEAAWGYRPPRLEVMAQGEVTLSSNSSNSTVHVYFDRPAGLVFGGVIPKGRYANISLLGQNLPPDSVAQFVANQELNPHFASPVSLLCNCTPRVAVSPAAGYFADRMVVVGDAAVTRLYKDGIGSAFITAVTAARTAISRGVSRQDFARGYRPACQRIAKDNLYGRFLFRLWGFSRRSPRLLNAWKQAIRSEASLPAEKRVHERALWGMFTGDDSYRTILSLLLSNPAMRTFFGGLIRARRRG